MNPSLYSMRPSCLSNNHLKIDRENPVIKKFSNSVNNPNSLKTSKMRKKLSIFVFPEGGEILACSELNKYPSNVAIDSLWKVVGHFSKRHQLTQL